MNEYRTIKLQIYHARLESLAFVGGLIGSGIFALWSRAKKLTTYALARVKARIESPDEPKGLPPVHF